MPSKVFFLPLVSGIVVEVFSIEAVHGAIGHVVASIQDLVGLLSSQLLQRCGVNLIKLQLWEAEIGLSLGNQVSEVDRRMGPQLCLNGVGIPVGVRDLSRPDQVLNRDARVLQLFKR